LEHYNIRECVNEKSDPERFFIFTCVVGSGEIFYKGESLPINKGDTVLIPAGLGEYTLVGQMEVLKTYVPDFKKVQEEIMYIVEN
jgi:mannose-6-phosphate isomerase